MGVALAEGGAGDGRWWRWPRSDRGEGPPSTAPAPAAAAVAAGLATLLYIFKFPPDREGAIALVGGFGSAPLFAAAGWLADWASERVPLARTAVFAALFGVLGVSFNLALHPSPRTPFASDMLPCLALSVLTVAAWRRAVRPRPGADAALAVVPLVVHLALRPSSVLPAFPGSQYLVGGPGGADAATIYALCPWLSLAVVGAWARRESRSVVLIAAALFGVAGACVVGLDPGGAGRLVKLPMSTSYALLALAVGSALLGVGRALMRSEGPPVRALAWLGRHWLVAFYVMFAAEASLRRSPVASSWAVLGLQAAGVLAGTWLVATVAAAAPVAAFFRHRASWALLAAVILGVAVWPGLPVQAITATAGIAGLVFASQYESLARLCVGTREEPLRSPGTATPKEVAAGAKAWQDSPAGDGPARRPGRLAGDPGSHRLADGVVVDRATTSVDRCTAGLRGAGRHGSPTLRGARFLRVGEKAFRKVNATYRIPIGCVPPARLARAPKPPPSDASGRRETAKPADAVPAHHPDPPRVGSGRELAT